MKKCKECSNKITEQSKSGLCSNCSQKYKSITHGRTCADKRNNYKCSDCHNPISYVSAVYGKGKCASCGQKGIVRNAWNKGIKNSTGHRLIETNKNTIIKHHIYLEENSEETIKMAQGQHRSLHWKGYEYLVYLGIVKEYIKEFCNKYPETMSAKEIRHHIDCNRENNNEDNFLWIASKELHNKLHQDAYGYLVKQGMIKKYLNWFFEKEKKDQLREEKCKGGTIL